MQKFNLDQIVQNVLADEATENKHLEDVYRVVLMALKEFSDKHRETDKAINAGKEQHEKRVTLSGVIAGYIVRTVVEESGKEYEEIIKSNFQEPFKQEKIKANEDSLTHEEKIYKSHILNFQNLKK